MAKIDMKKINILMTLGDPELIGSNGSVGTGHFIRFKVVRFQTNKGRNN